MQKLKCLLSLFRKWHINSNHDNMHITYFYNKGHSMTKTFPSFLTTKQNFLDTENIHISNIQVESESYEYEAVTCTYNKQTIKFRKAKITPTKTGQFVTIWKRNTPKTIAPYDITDNIKFVIIYVESDTKKGIFIFPQSVLIKYNIFSQNNIGGKRAIRVYPAWDNPTSKQAQATQKWQITYFIDHTNKNNIQKLLIQNLELKHN